jgi:hypothetical protein
VVGFAGRPQIWAPCGYNISMNEELNLGFWTGVLARKETNWKATWASNETLGPVVYLNDVVPYKHILRAARLRASLPICWGATDCVDEPTATCAAGKHETCQRHATTCFLCKAENE